MVLQSMELGMDKAEAKSKMLRNTFRSARKADSWLNWRHREQFTLCGPSCWHLQLIIIEVRTRTLESNQGI